MSESLNASLLVRSVGAVRGVVTYLGIPDTGGVVAAKSLNVAGIAAQLVRSVAAVIFEVADQTQLDAEPAMTSILVFGA